MSVSVVRKMLREGWKQTDQRLTASDMISVSEAAALVGESPSTVRAWIAAGWCVGVKRGSSAVRLPRWQFDGDLLLWIGPITKALQPNSGWHVLSFLETPRGALEGRTPRQAIEQGDVDRVLLLASM